MTPPFDDNGLLPPGCHRTNWRDFSQRYGVTPHRRKLLLGLRAALDSLACVGCTKVWIDGSFVTRKETPGDFDVCWDVSGVDIDELDRIDPTLLIFENRRAAQKAKFGGELFPAQTPAESTPPFRIFLDFFQTDKGTGNRKGIIELDLRTWHS